MSRALDFVPVVGPHTGSAIEFQEFDRQDRTRARGTVPAPHVDWTTGTRLLSRRPANRGRRGVHFYSDKPIKKKKNVPDNRMIFIALDLPFYRFLCTVKNTRVFFFSKSLSSPAEAHLTTWIMAFRSNGTSTRRTKNFGSGPNNITSMSRECNTPEWLTTDLLLRIPAEKFLQRIRVG